MDETLSTYQPNCFFGDCLCTFKSITINIDLYINIYDAMCRFYVDDIPIRRYERKSEATYPVRPMWVYGSIWDASSWATEDGKYKADYKYQPFIGRYNSFKLGGCAAGGAASCRPLSSGPGGGGLSQQQEKAMVWVQSNYLVYNYCHDPRRDHTLIPEC